MIVGGQLRIGALCLYCTYDQILNEQRTEDKWYYFEVQVARTRF